MVTGASLDAFLNMPVRRFREFVMAINAAQEKRSGGAR